MSGGYQPKRGTGAPMRPPDTGPGGTPPGRRGPGDPWARLKDEMAGELARYFFGGFDACPSRLRPGLDDAAAMRCLDRALRPLLRLVPDLPELVSLRADAAGMPKRASNAGGADAARGFAVVDGDDLCAETTSPTPRAAMVNFLVSRRNMLVWSLATDELIERAWEERRAGARVVAVSIVALSDDDVPEARQ